MRLFFGYNVKYNEYIWLILMYDLNNYRYVFYFPSLSVELMSH